MYIYKNCNRKFKNTYLWQVYQKIKKNLKKKNSEPNDSTTDAGQIDLIKTRWEIEFTSIRISKW